MIRILSFIFSLAMSTSAFAQTQDSKVLHEKTESRLREIAGKIKGTTGLCAVNLASGERFAINDKEVFPQASAIKIAILMEVFKQAGEGKFKLTDIRTIRGEDKTGGSGVLAELGNGTVQMTIRDLCVLMILLSDNTATNMLIDLVGKEKLTATMAGLGLRETKLQRRMMDTAAVQRGEDNFSTPAEAAQIMGILYKNEFISRAVCEDILSILKKAKTTNLKSGLPEGVEIASKPGGLPTVTTEWAVIYLKERPFVVAVMNKNGQPSESGPAFKEISKVLYEYFAGVAKNVQ